MADSEIRNLTAETSALAARQFPAQDSTDRATRVANSLVGAFEIDTTYNTSANHADFSLEVGKRHLVHLGGLTSEVVVTLPASADVGEQCAITITADAPATQGQEAEITAAAGDTLNGVAGGTQWSRIWQTNETLVFECEAADATWRVAQDGRIACHSQIYQSSSVSSFFAANNTFYSVTFNTEDFDPANVLQIANDYFEARRAGRYELSASAQGVSINNATEFLARFVKDAGGTPVTMISDPVLTGASGTATATPKVCVDVAIADLGTTSAQFTLQARINAGAPKNLNGGANHVTHCAVKEVLGG